MIGSEEAPKKAAEALREEEEGPELVGGALPRHDTRFSLDTHTMLSNSSLLSCELTKPLFSINYPLCSTQL